MNLNMVNSIGFLVFLLLFAATHSASSEFDRRKSSYAQLESMAVLYDIYHAERSILYPENDFVFLTFSQKYGANIYLDRMELHLDGQPVETHHYTGDEILLLMNLAVQEVYATLVTPGEHTLEAKLFGVGLVNKQYIKGSTTFNKGPGTLFLSVEINGGELEFQQWN